MEEGGDNPCISSTFVRSYISAMRRARYVCHVICHKISPRRCRHRCHSWTRPI